MRKTLALVVLTASLTGGSAAVATTALAAPVAAPPVAQTQEVEDAVTDDGENDKTGLWGLLGLLGLAGLAKKKERVETADPIRH